MTQAVVVYDSSGGTYASAGTPLTLGGGVSSLAKSGSSALTGAVTLSAGSNVTLTQSGNNIAIASSGGSGLGAKLYDFTISGSDQAAIDTNVDGSTVANFSGYDILEIWMLTQTDEAAAAVVVNCTVNNDTSSIYDRQYVRGNNVTASAAQALAAAFWAIGSHGSSGSTSYPGVARISIPSYAVTTFWKVAEAMVAYPDATAGNNNAIGYMLGYRATTAISRFKVTAIAGQKLKVGSRLIVYGR